MMLLSRVWQIAFLTVVAAAQTNTRSAISVRPAKSALAKTGAYHALIIGIDRYQHEPVLQTPVDDATAVDVLLRERYGFRTKLLLDAEATRDNILDSLARYSRSLQAEDSFLIYYAGHGTRDGDKAYWLPVDADPGSTARWIIADDITSRMRVIPASHVLVISDSCYSGGLSRDATSNAASATDNSGDHDAAIAKLLRSKSRILISSGRDEPVADGGGKGHSIFASALLAGFSKMSTTAFSSFSLFASMNEAVIGGSQQVPLYQIIRDSGHDGGDFVFSRGGIAPAAGDSSPDPGNAPAPIAPSNPGNPPRVAAGGSDDSLVRVDCNSATPQQMQLAIKAYLADRVVAMWHCRPENAGAPGIQLQFALLFGKQEFPMARPFLDELLAKGWNFIMDTSPRIGYGRTANGWMKYGNSPVYIAMKGDTPAALEWLIAHAPAGYWKKYPYLLGDLLDQYSWYASVPKSGEIQAIGLLRKTGVPADYSEFQPFRVAYRNWLEWEYPEELRRPLFPPANNALVPSMSGYEASKTRPPAEAERLKAGWQAVSDALAPASPDALKASKTKVLSEFTKTDLEVAELEIQRAETTLAGTWWRKLPETAATLQEAARRQAQSAFDGYGYVAVAPGDLRESDLQPSGTKVPVHYPNCNCSTLADVRQRLAAAQQRKTSILNFCARHQ